MRSLQKLVRNYIEPLKSAFDTRVTTDGGTNEANDTQIDTWINPWKAKILTHPNAFKAGKLYSIYPENGDGDFDVVRATDATRVNESGEIETVASNVPRIDYLNGEPIVLVEPASTNLLLRSEEFDNAYWPKAAVSVTPNATTSPDGTMTADKLIESAANSNHLLNKTSLVFSPNTISVFAKANERNWIRLQGQAPANTWVNVNLTTGGIGLQGGGLSNVEINNFGNGWWRISGYNSASGGFGRGIQIFILDSDRGTNSPSYLGDGTSSIYIWGAQLEQASAPSSYIPTTTATVTRNADVIDVDVPVGTDEIVTTFEDDSTDIESSPGATYQLPNGRIKSVIFKS